LFKGNKWGGRGCGRDGALCICICECMWFGPYPWFRSW
jgi:hypothetical protein